MKIASRTGMHHEIGFVPAERMQWQRQRNAGAMGVKQHHVAHLVL